MCHTSGQRSRKEGGGQRVQRYLGLNAEALNRGQVNDLLTGDAGSAGASYAREYRPLCFAGEQDALPTLPWRGAVVCLELPEPMEGRHLKPSPRSRQAERWKLRPGNQGVDGGTFSSPAILVVVLGRNSAGSNSTVNTEIRCWWLHDSCTKKRRLTLPMWDVVSDLRPSLTCGKTFLAYQPPGHTRK